MKEPRTYVGAALDEIARPVRFEVGGAVEDPQTKLWHVAASSDETNCGADCATWPRVAHATARAGIWCGRCLLRLREQIGEESEDIEGYVGR